MKNKLFLSIALLAAMVLPQAMQAQQTLTIHDGTTTMCNVPTYPYYWDDFTRSQCVYPASELTAMNGATITGLTFYTTNYNIPYTSVSEADVYLKEVDYTTISAFEAKASATVVYHGTFDFVAAEGGGRLTITFSTPYTYHGGNLLIGIENTTDAEYVDICFYGETVTGASVYGTNSVSLDNVAPTQLNCLPKVTFIYNGCPEGKVCLGSEETTSTHLPLSTHYNYSISEQIYTASEIGTSGVISGVDFYMSAGSGNVTRNIDIYLKKTTKNSFNDNNDWISATEEDLVFSGDVTFSPEAWTSIEFDAPFGYYGGGNLVLIVNDKTGNYVPAIQFGAFTPSSDTYQALQWASDGDNVNPANPPFGNGSLTASKNCVRFAIGEESCPEGKVCIGSGGSVNFYLPTYEFFNYSLTEQIYTAAELGAAGAINSIDFFYLGEVTRNLDIYLVSTEKNTFESQTDWIAATEDDLVFSGNVTFTADGWTTIDFDNPFLYNGVGNVALVVVDNTGTYMSSLSCRVFAASSQALRICSDSRNFDPANLVDGLGTVMSLKNCVRFAIEPPSVCDAPYDLRHPLVTSNSAFLTWVDDYSPDHDSYNVRYAAVGTLSIGGWTVVENVPYPYLDLSDLTPNTPYMWQVQGVTDECEGGVTAWSETNTFLTKEIHYFLQFMIACNSYQVRNSVGEVVAFYDASGVYEIDYVDPIMGGVHVTLDLTIVDHYHSYREVANCGPYTWGRTGQTYNKSGLKYFKGTAEDGCPIRDTLALTIVDHYGSNYAATSCGPYYWFVADRTYNKGGRKVYTGTADDGCPIRDTLNLTIVDHWGGNTAVTSCGPYTWTTNGKTYNKGGKKSYTGTAVDGCPIRDTLNLTIVDRWTNHEVVTSCGPYTWDVNGKTYNKGGVKTYKGTAADGCPIYDTLTLTVASDRSSHVYVNSCGPYTWAVNGKTYSKSGVKTNKGTTEEGCAQRDTLTLTIVDRLTNHEVVTNCGPYTWAVNGKTYAKSGVKTYKGTSPEGCPVYDTLTLTVLESPTSHEYVTSCGAYTWSVNGKTYNKSGEKTNKGTTADGCPIRDTLTLTIVDHYGTNTVVTNCGPYTWAANGKTYNKGGRKSYTGTAADGCPIRDTLTLTIVDKYSNHEYVTNCGPYTWAVNGRTYNQSGVKTYKSTAADGCPVYDTLTLTINDCKGNSEATSNLSPLTSNLSVYPNPTTGLVHIDVKSNSENNFNFQLSTFNLTVEVLDLVGRRVALFENTNTLDLTNLAAGTYTLRVTLPDAVVIRKVVKR